MAEHAPRCLLIDTDPGVDDALAILMAFAAGVEVAALTVTAGNVGLGHTVANALKLVEVAGRDTPVYAGCDRPLVRPAGDAAFVHGHDGFGDTAYLPAASAVRTGHAAEAICRLARERPGELTIVALGPLSNLALALSLDPALPSRTAGLVVMGGAVTGRGNTDRVPAEFNIGFDPESAHLVFSRWPRFRLVDWEAVLRHGLAHAQFERWLQADSPQARFYAAISRRTRDWARAGRGDGHWHSADALAMLVALQPDAVTACAERWVGIELDGALTRGATVVDWDRRSGNAANAAIVGAVDQARFEAAIRAALGAGPGAGSRG